jgi:hypothetical protein
MKNIFINLTGTIFFLSLIAGCNSKSEKATTTVTSDSAIVIQLVHDWNKAHLSKDVSIFSNLYGNNVLFYGTQLNKNSCIEKKLSLFKICPDFYQEIYGDIQVENQSDSVIKCSFLKRVTINQKTKDYPSYLVLKKSGKSWKIITEGDLVTDKNLFNKPESKIIVPKDAVEGDYNGDGKLESMWLVPPTVNDNAMDCEGKCFCTIKFSDSAIPIINIDNCIGGTPVNEGDLNSNGSDEIGLHPEWFTSCWGVYYVWTYKNGKWIYAVDPISTHCNQWDQDVKPIEVDRKREGYVIIRYSEFEDGEIKIKSKSVKIEK